MIIGMDFGTTNSGLAVYDGRQTRLLPMEAAGPDPGVIRSALHVANDQKATIGQAAINLYLEQNLGRPVRMERVWVGEIEAIYADMFYVRDVYTWTDVLSPGRLLLSFKSGLHSVDYQGTTIGNSFFFLEDIITLYLYLARLRAERLLGQPVRQVVLGRPVKYATDATEDRLAQERFLAAALRAGYEQVYLEYEPIAAAFHYETTISKEQNVLVFDFGGGTLDLTVMRLGDPRRRQVLATGGLPIAGDVFDQKLARAKLPRHFGEGALVSLDNQKMPVPAWLYDTFADWQQLLLLQTPENLRLLRELAQASAEPGKIQALMALVSGNYGLKMFAAVEQAKRTLSQQTEAVIRLQGPGFDVTEPVTRREFEAIIQPETQKIEELLDDTVRASGLPPDEIDAVIRTGGSSQIPVFQQMLYRKFGPQRVRSVDVFSSVACGLGIIAHGIETGQIQAAAYSPDRQIHAQQTFARPGVARVNLDLLLERIQVQESATVGASPQEPDYGLIWLGKENVLTAALASPALLAQSGPVSLHDVLPAATGQPIALLVAHLDEPLLLVTSRYRLLLVTLRQFMAAQGQGMSMAAMQRLEPEEQVCAIHRWADVKDRPRLTLITRMGLTIWYDLPRLRHLIEGPVPFKLSIPAIGWPLAVLGLRPEDEIVAITTGGRATRTPVSLLSTQETKLIAVAKGGEERVMAALPGSRADQMLVVTTDGHARRIFAAWIPLAERPGAPGRSLIARGELAGAALLRPYTETKVWAVTSSRLIPLSPYRVPQEDEASKKLHPALTLLPGEQVSGILSHRIT